MGELDKRGTELVLDSLVEGNGCNSQCCGPECV
jgi:hypothetical protein